MQYLPKKPNASLIENDELRDAAGKFLFQILHFLKASQKNEKNEERVRRAVQEGGGKAVFVLCQLFWSCSRAQITTYSKRPERTSGTSDTVETLTDVLNVLCTLAGSSFRENDNNYRSLFHTILPCILRESMNRVRASHAKTDAYNSVSRLKHEEDSGSLRKTFPYIPRDILDISGVRALLQSRLISWPMIKDACEEYERFLGKKCDWGVSTGPSPYSTVPSNGPGLSSYGNSGPPPPSVNDHVTRHNLPVGDNPRLKLTPNVPESMLIMPYSARNPRNARQAANLSQQSIPKMTSHHANSTAYSEDSNDDDQMSMKNVKFESSSTTTHRSVKVIDVPSAARPSSSTSTVSSTGRMLFPGMTKPSAALRDPWLAQSIQHYILSIPFEQITEEALGRSNRFSSAKDSVGGIPSKFASVQEYQKVFERLLHIECLAQVCAAKVELGLDQADSSNYNYNLHNRRQLYLPAAHITGVAVVDEWHEITCVFANVPPSCDLGEFDFLGSELVRSAPANSPQDDGLPQSSSLWLTALVTRVQSISPAQPRFSAYSASHRNLQACLRIKLPNTPAALEIRASCLKPGASWQWLRITSLVTEMREALALMNLPSMTRYLRVLLDPSTLLTSTSTSNHLNNYPNNSASNSANSSSLDFFSGAQSEVSGECAAYLKTATVTRDFPWSTEKPTSSEIVPRISSKDQNIASSTSSDCRLSSSSSFVGMASVLEFVEKTWSINASQALAACRAVSPFFLPDPTLPSSTNYNSNNLASSSGGIAYNSPLVLIQGPPGTGKTRTIQVILGMLLGRPHPALAPLRLSQSTRRILVCAPSNAAVDEIVRRLIAHPTKATGVDDNIKMGRGQREGIWDAYGHSVQPFVVRIGNHEAIAEDVRHVTLEALMTQTYSAGSGNPEDPGGAEGADSRPVLRDQIRDLRLALDVAEDPSSNPTPDASHVQKLKAALRKAQSDLRSSQSGEERRQAARASLLQRAQVIACTLSGAGHETISRLALQDTGPGPVFDVFIVDEACQAVEPSTLIALSFNAPRTILVGDPLQLPPTILSWAAVQGGYEQSLFARIQSVLPQCVTLLSTQYRMHPAIAAFPSRHFYGGALKTAAADEASREQPLSLSAYRFFDVQEGAEQRTRFQPASHARTKAVIDKSVANEAEGKAAVSLVSLLAHRDGISPNRIAIITPYKEQARRIRKELRTRLGVTETDCQVSTVDSFQGQERDIVIFSCVRTQPVNPSASGSSTTASIGFLQDTRRLNVALTRARLALYILGHVKTLEGSRQPLWTALIADAKLRGSLGVWEEESWRRYRQMPLSQTLLGHPVHVRAYQNDQPPNNGKDTDYDGPGHGQRYHGERRGYQQHPYRPYPGDNTMDVDVEPGQLLKHYSKSNHLKHTKPHAHHHDTAKRRRQRDRQRSHTNGNAPKHPHNPAARPPPRKYKSTHENNKPINSDENTGKSPTKSAKQHDIKFSPSKHK